MNSAADDDSSYRDERYSNDVHQLVGKGKHASCTGAEQNRMLET